MLAPYVNSLHVYDVDLGRPGVHRGLPSTSLTLVLPVDEPLDVAWAGRSASRRVDWSSVSGLHASPAEIRHSGRQRGVQLALTPAGARALLGVPAAALSGELLALDEVAPHLRGLPDAVAQVAAAQRPRVVARALIQSLARLDRPAPRAEVGEALARLTRGAGVQQVADAVGLSRRHLGELVRAEYGLAPKTLQRIGRFEASKRLMATGTPLTDVASSCGYADQAHLTREWVELAGCPPGTWRREELPFLQDTASLHEAG